MHCSGWSLVLLLTAVLAVPALAADATPGLGGFSAEEVRHVLRHGPWPQAVQRDRSNRASGNPAAVALGRALFFENRLSAGRAMSCASCHLPGQALSDASERGQGRVRLDRNTPGLWNVGLARWFGWDGAADSLWAFAIRPLLHPDEMAATPRHVAALIRRDATLACWYRRAYGAPPGGDPERMLSAVAKALAAYLETLISGKSDFDFLHDALAGGDAAAAARYPADARRGLEIFFGRGKCAVCHFGPNFTNGEFHDIGIPYLVAPGRVDPGRHGGIVRVKGDRFNRLGEFSDDPAGTSAAHTRHVVQNHTTYGQFKVPSLRNVALTAPYMHNGLLRTLHEVVRHYSELPEERLHQDGEALLQPLKFSGEEIDAVVAFLRTLTSREFPDAGPANLACR